MTSSHHAMSQEEVMAYLDGELPPERAREVLAHVASCDECRNLTDGLRGVSHRMADWSVEVAPVGLRVPAVPVAERVAGRRSPWRRRSVWAVAAAAVIVVAAAGTYSRARRAGAPARPSAMALESPAESIDAATPVARSAVVGQSDTAGLQGRGPVIARSARLRLLARDIDTARAALDRVVRDLGGFVGDISAGGNRGSRWAHATLRVPADKLDAAIAALRPVGQVLEESVHAEDVTEQSVDLDLRMANGKRTEQRLVELLGNRTGTLSDVLAVERELGRVRTELERLDAERKNLDRRVLYATLRVEIGEEPRASVTLGPTSMGTRMRNAVVVGTRTALGSIIAVVLLAITIAPTLLVWALLLAWPVTVLARRWLRRRQPVV